MLDDINAVVEEERGVLEFYRTLTSHEKVELVQALTSRSLKAFRNFEDFYRQSRGLSAAEWPAGQSQADPPQFCQMP